MNERPRILWIEFEGRGAKAWVYDEMPEGWQDGDPIYYAHVIEYSAYEALDKKLNNTTRCNKGHETLPLVLWDCPDCHEETKKQRDKFLAERDMNIKSLVEIEKWIYDNLDCNWPALKDSKINFVLKSKFQTAQKNLTTAVAITESLITETKKIIDVFENIAHGLVKEIKGSDNWNCIIEARAELAKIKGSE
jgi:hypothetical protein